MSEPSPRVQNAATPLRSGQPASTGGPGPERAPSAANLTEELRATPGIEAQERRLATDPEPSRNVASGPPTQPGEDDRALADHVGEMRSGMSSLARKSSRLDEAIETMLANGVARAEASAVTAKAIHQDAMAAEGSGLERLIEAVESVTFITLGVRQVFSLLKRKLTSGADRHGALADIAQASGAGRAAAANGAPPTAISALSQQITLLGSQLGGLEEQLASVAMDGIEDVLDEVATSIQAADRRAAFVTASTASEASATVEELLAVCDAARLRFERAAQILRAKRAGTKPNDLLRGTERRSLLDAVVAYATAPGQWLRMTDVGTRHVGVDLLSGKDYERDIEFETMLTSPSRELMDELISVGGGHVVALGTGRWGRELRAGEPALLAGAKLRRDHHVRDDIVVAHLDRVVREVPAKEWSDIGSRRAWIRQAKATLESVMGPGAGPAAAAPRQRR